MPQPGNKIICDYPSNTGIKKGKFQDLSVTLTDEKLYGKTDSTQLHIGQIAARLNSSINFIMIRKF